MQERQGEAHAQRGPVRRCMADLETRSPQGETRGPKRRPRKIGRNSRESRLFLSRVIQRVRSFSLSMCVCLCAYVMIVEPRVTRETSV